MLAPPLKVASDRPYTRRWPALMVLSVAILMIVAANTSLMVAVTTIQQKVGATSTQSRWILDAYPLAVASLLLFFGGIGDRYGRRINLNLGLIGFAAASAWGALSHSANELIAARAMMGVAGALIMPATLAYVRVLFPASERKKAFSIWSGASGVALGIGPLAAGALVSPIGWSAVFWLGVPLSVLLLVGSVFTVPASRNASAPRIDYLGAALSISVLAPLMYGIIEGNSKGWFSSTVLGSFGFALIALVLFVAWERHTPEPMLDLKWFRAPAFRMGTSLITLGFTAGVGLIYVTVLFIQQDLLHSALTTGVDMTPLGALLAGAALNSALAKRFGLRVPVIVGLLLLAAGCAVVGASQSGYLPIGIALGVGGFGIGVFLPTLTEAVMDSAPKTNGGVAGASADASLELGAALGVAVLGSVLTTCYDNRLPAAISRLPAAARSAVHGSDYGAHAVAAKLPAAEGNALVQAANHAFVHGLSRAAVVGAGICLASAVIALRMPRRLTVADAGGSRESAAGAGPTLRPATDTP